MSFGEKFNSEKSECLSERLPFARFRRDVHRAMKVEEEVRLRENPHPTEQELHVGVFKEWLEPQVRSAIFEMYRKGYATQSSGFHGTKCDLQMIDGPFLVDEKTKEALSQMGVDVLRGADIGLPLNRTVTVLGFRATEPSIEKIKEKWDAVAAALPEKKLPEGVVPISDRVEEFRKDFAPEHPSLEDARRKYWNYIRKENGLDEEAWDD